MKDKLIDLAAHMALHPDDAVMQRSPAMMDKMIRQIMNYPCMALPSVEDPAILCGVVHDMGIGEVWMLVGHSFETRWRSIIRQHRQLCMTIYDGLHLHRMHMLVDPRRVNACRYAEAVGFEFEFTARRFSVMGADMSFYVWPHTQKEEPYDQDR